MSCRPEERTAVIGMGNRCYLFLQEEGQDVGLEQCVAETNNRFALEWFAWLPADALDAHATALIEHRRRFERDHAHAGGDVDGDVTTAGDNRGGPPDTAVGIRTIRVPYREAVAEARRVIAPALATRPQLASTLAALWRSMERRAATMRNPVLRFELLEMANRDGIDRYVADLRRHHDFWSAATPWDDVRESADETGDALHPEPPPLHEQERLDALRSRADELATHTYEASNATGNRWRDHHGTAVVWLLVVLSAAAFFAGYAASGTIFVGFCVFLVVAVLASWLTFRRPTPRGRDPHLLSELREVRTEIARSDVGRGGSSAEIDLPDDESLRRWPPARADGGVTWNDEGFEAALWAGGRLAVAWRDVDSLGYTLDDGPSDAATVWTVKLRDGAEDRSPYDAVDGPLWFCFDREMSPAVLLTCVNLLRDVYGTRE